MHGCVDAGASEAVLPLRPLATEGGPLVGMGLLRGSRLGIDVVPGGSVVVEELS